MEEMLKRFQQTPNVISKGKSGKKLTPEGQLGVDRLADLDKEIEKATKKNEMSEKQFETEMRIQEIMKGTEGVTRDQIRAKLDQLNVLAKEQEEIQKVKNLYDSIASSIETGIVDALEGAINGTKTLGDVASSVFAQIQRSLLQFGVNSFLGAIGIPGFANGGRATWNGRDIDGNKVPTGVYLIFTSDDMGDEKISGKILIIK